MDALIHNSPTSPSSTTIGDKIPELAYDDRRAVRLIISKCSGQVAIFHVEQHDYYGLPGGEIGHDEDHHIAAFGLARKQIGVVVGVGMDCLALSKVRMRAA